MLTKAATLAIAAVVSMGDSFIAGEGGGDYGGSGGCHRSATAPIRSAAVPGTVAVNLACSGARLRNLWPAAAGGAPFRGEPPQADRLAALARRRPVRAVVVTAGANDAGFSRLVAACALAWARGSLLAPRPCRGRAQERLEAELPALAAAMRAAAAAAGAEFLDVGAALDGHRLCERGAEPAAAGGGPARAEWVRPLRFAPAELRESLHPNALGQRALGRCIALHLARPPGDSSCRAAPDLPPAAVVGLGRP
jgi:lysophospholipase L1-like esterase